VRITKQKTPFTLLTISWLYLGFFIVLPLLALIVKGVESGPENLLESFHDPHLLFALRLTLIISLIVTGINILTGTLVAWVLVRYDFPGKNIIDALIDVPFAIPTVVTGLMILTVYGPHGVVGDFFGGIGGRGIEVIFGKPGILLALLVVTLPFVVRSVQPVLIVQNPSLEEAAETLGASRLQTFFRVILPPVIPSMLTGGALSFTRSLGEFGSVVVVAGNIPMKTQVASVYIYAQIESGNMTGAIALSLVLLGFAVAILGFFKLFENFVKKTMSRSKYSEGSEVILEKKC